MQSIKGQLTVRGILIGSAGCVVITAASAYTALKMGALPWPIVFAAIVSLFFLKALGRGKASLNEANVTHTVKMCIRDRASPACQDATLPPPCGTEAA